MVAYPGCRIAGFLSHSSAWSALPGRKGGQIPPSGEDRVLQPEFRSCEVLWEETPHSARYSRHPLPKGEGRNRLTLTALSLGERVSRSRRSRQPVRDG